MAIRTKAKRTHRPLRKSTGKLARQIQLAAALRRLADRHKGTDLLVAFAIAMLGWNRTATFTDSVGAIESFTGCSRRSVQRSIARLVKKGDLERQAKVDGGTKRNGWLGGGVVLVWKAPIAECDPTSGTGRRRSGKHAFCDAPAETPAFAVVPDAPASSEKRVTPVPAEPPPNARDSLGRAHAELVGESYARAYGRKHQGLEPPRSDAVQEPVVSVVIAAAEQLAARCDVSVTTATRHLMHAFVSLSTHEKHVPVKFLPDRVDQILPIARDRIQRAKIARAELEASQGERERGAA